MQHWKYTCRPTRTLLNNHIMLGIQNANYKIQMYFTVLDVKKMRHAD